MDMMQVGCMRVDMIKGFMGMPVTMTPTNKLNIRRAGVIVMFVWMRMIVAVFHRLV
jgi:hypothetical protein